MADPKSCSKCGRRLNGQNTTGHCWNKQTCSARAGGGLLASMKPPPPARRVKKTPPGVSWLERFRQLHTALGLDADEAIETHCRSWVEAVTSRALGQAAAKPVRLHARPPEQLQADAVGTGG